MQTQPKHDEMFENIECASGEKAGDIEETVSIIQERERKNTLSRAISRKVRTANNRLQNRKQNGKGDRVANQGKPTARYPSHATSLCLIRALLPRPRQHWQCEDRRCSS